jgi:hypothetical protein
MATDDMLDLMSPLYIHSACNYALALDPVTKDV